MMSTTHLVLCDGCHYLMDMSTRDEHAAHSDVSCKIAVIATVWMAKEQGKTEEDFAGQPWDGGAICDALDAIKLRTPGLLKKVVVEDAQETTVGTAPSTNAAETAGLPLQDPPLPRIFAEHLRDGKPACYRCGDSFASHEEAARHRLTDKTCEARAHAYNFGAITGYDLVQVIKEAGMPAMRREFFSKSPY